MAISGTSVAITTAGGVLVYSAIRGHGIGEALHAIFTGQATNPIAATTPALDQNLGTPSQQAQLNLLTSPFTGGAGTGTAVAAVEYALAQVGKPYVWGATGPNGFDCSGLVWAAYRAAGVPVSPVRWTTYTMLASLPNVPIKQAWAGLRPGDLVFPDVGHVVMVVDPNAHTIVEAPHTGENVRVMVYDSEYSSIFAIRRVVK